MTKIKNEDLVEPPITILDNPKIIINGKEVESKPAHLSFSLESLYITNFIIVDYILRDGYEVTGIIDRKDRIDLTKNPSSHEYELIISDCENKLKFAIGFSSLSGAALASDGIIHIFKNGDNETENFTVNTFQREYHVKNKKRRFG